eukprot:Skav229642  [mRNA]  locus=scaffold649:313161:315617:+ [translate_table: standard]
MRPNTSKGKTEVLLHLTGSGAKEWKTSFFNKGGDPHIPVVTDTGIVPIHVVPSYRHLGGIVHHSGSGLPELRHRFGQAHQAFSEHQKLIFRNPKIELPQKRALLESLVLSKLLYGIETLLVSKPSDLEAMNTALHKLFKRALGTPRDAHVTHDDVLVGIGMPDFRTLHRRSRLRYYGTALRCTDGRLWGLFTQDRAWKSAMLDDLRWMWSRLLLQDPLPDPAIDLVPWHQLILQRPGFWKKLVARAVRLEVLHRQNEHVMTSFYNRFGHRLRELDILPEESQQPEPSTVAYGCLGCKFAAKSKAGEAVHMFKVHGVVAPERHLFDSTQCRACLREFHTSRRIQLHLRASEQCRNRLSSFAAVDAPMPGQGSCQERALQQLHDNLVPTLQAQGPQLPHRRPLADPFDLNIFELIMETMLPEPQPWSDIEEVFQAVRAALSARPLAWTAVCTTIRAVHAALTDEEAEIIGYPRAMIQVGLLELTDPTSWTFLREGPLQPAAQHRHTWLHWEQLCDEFLQETEAVQGDYVPRPFSAHRVLLHLFSGRRRYGDIQDYLERLPPQEGTTLHVLSIDIVFDDRWGNLADPTTQQWWIANIRSGWIVGMLAGPPCSTWSKARGNIVAGRRFAPRVIRTVDRPWGIQQVAVRELLQLLMGNQLLVFCLEALLELWWVGGSAVMEHPACPDDTTKASIWRTTPIQVLERLPGFQHVKLCQGYYGAKSAKPTQLFVLNMPYLQQMMEHSVITSDLPQAASIGVGEQGEWKTTSLKEYPPALNRGLAGSFNQFLQAAPICARQPPSAFWQATASMEAAFGVAMGPDCPL